MLFTLEISGEIMLTVLSAMAQQESENISSHVLDFCINTISGRYPEKVYCTNKKCKKLYIIIQK